MTRKARHPEDLVGGPPHSPGGRLAAELVAVSFFAEADEPGLAGANGWRAQVARRTDCCLLERFVVEGVLLRLERQDLLALCDVDLRGVGEQCADVVGAEPFLARVDRLTDGDSGVLEERVRALAARSTLAVVVPVNL